LLYVTYLMLFHVDWFLTAIPGLVVYWYSNQ
jgi:hypothetical protein